MNRVWAGWALFRRRIVKRDTGVGAVFPVVVELGMVFGAAFLGHWGDRVQHKPLPLIGFVMMGFVLGMFAFTRQLWLGFSLSALFGFGASLINGPMQALIQEQTPESMRGKVFGLENNAIILLSACL